MHRKKRFRLLVYPRFQLTLIALNSLIFLVSSFVMVGSFYVAIGSLRDLGVRSELAENHPYFTYLSMETESIFLHFVIAVIVSLLVTSFVTLYLSHKVSGPILRLKSYFNDVRHQKAVLPLSFRKGDYFCELPLIITQALKVLFNDKKK